jgi:hypothetical protein
MSRRGTDPPKGLQTGSMVEKGKDAVAGLDKKGLLLHVISDNSAGLEQRFLL